MKVVVATDSFKGSLSSMEAGNAIKRGIKQAHPYANVIVRPLADGGEGTVEALVEGMNGTYHYVNVTNPLGQKVKACYGIIECTTAVIEIASAAGITLIDTQEKNPMLTTTYGVGEIIIDALSKGCRRFIIGLGGSVTNDGGAGMLQALGFDLLDSQGQPIPQGAQGLKKLMTIHDAHVFPELKKCDFLIACDVNNPLCGPQGASAVYGPQKGATPDMVKELDDLLEHFSKITKKYNSYANPSLSGCGAAGGLGFAFFSFLQGQHHSGIKLILKETHLESYLTDADLVITGEGRLDFQTAMGKAPIGVAQLAKKYHLPVIAFAGSVTENAIECHQHGIDAFFPILREIITLDEAMLCDVAQKNLTNTVEQVFRLWSLK